MFRAWRTTRRACTYALGALASISATGCDPLAYIVVRQPLQPLGRTECLAKALAAAPHVAWVQPRKNLNATNFQITVRDSLRADSITAAEFSLETGEDSIERGTIRFLWMGRLASVPAARRDRWLKIGVEVLESVRQACTPGSVAPPTCGELEWAHEHTRSCAPAT